MRKLFKYLFYLLLCILSIIAFYFFLAYLFSLFHQKDMPQEQQKQSITILYSSMHTDIVFNIKNINLSTFPKFKNKKYGYLAFGWGDKETYLNTPNIKDIKISTSLKALFINTPSLMHVSYIPNISRYKNIKKIQLTLAQKQSLQHSIMQSFKKERKVYKGYGKEDFFYDAKGQYNAINTCNTWTGEKLRDVNVSLPSWTPVAWSITNALP